MAVIVASLSQANSLAHIRMSSAQFSAFAVTGVAARSCAGVDLGALIKLLLARQNAFVQHVLLSSSAHKACPVTMHKSVFSAHIAAASMPVLLCVSCCHITAPLLHT